MLSLGLPGDHEPTDLTDLRWRHLSVTGDALKSLLAFPFLQLAVSGALRQFKSLI